MKNILFVASEAVPFIKTGGLADVAGTLPKCFDKKYFDVRVIIPKYMCIPEEIRFKFEYLDHFYMYYNGRNRYVGILRLDWNGVPVYFIDRLLAGGAAEAAPEASRATSSSKTMRRMPFMGNLPKHISFQFFLTEGPSGLFPGRAGILLFFGENIAVFPGFY